MNCLTDGELRSWMDGEGTALDSTVANEHLRSCGRCQERSAEIAAGAKEVGSLLGTEVGTVDAAAAYRRYRQSVDRHGRRAFEFSWRKLWRGPIWAGTAAVCAFALLLSFAPARGWGQKILDMLRVQKVAVVPVDFSALDQTTAHSAAKLLAQMIADNVVVTMKPGQPTVAADATAASALAGFPVKSLDEAGIPGRILVNGEAAFQMTLNRDRMEGVLEAAGRPDIQIPASVDGSLVAVHIPKMVRQLFGDCGRPLENGAEDGVGNCMAFMQVPSPIVSVPPGLNLGALAEAALQVTGMSAADAHAFSQTVDWSSTLVIPIPQRGGSSRTVPVDGVNGTLVEMAVQGKSSGAYTLIWVKNGIVYALEGRGNSNQALAAAGSLN
jgi:hypothetical protein